MDEKPQSPPGPVGTGADLTATVWGGPRSRGAEELSHPGTQVGRYVVLDVVGTGGMGVVYAAYDPELDRKVALKLLRQDRTGGPDRLRLLREAQAIARLSHPNVIQVYDAGTFGDQVFVAMELVEGRTLRRWLEEAPRSWREVAALFLVAGRGLAAAHAAGLVHRDFKPDNVLLGEDGRVRVVDFGLARPVAREDELPAPASVAVDLSLGGAGALTAPLTQEGAALGTPAYMAPEQLRGEAAGARSDQFSFCATLYEALYGERPFAGASVGELAGSYARGEVREAPAGSRVPAWLRQAVLRGLSVDPEDRYLSMEELLGELGRDPAVLRRRRLAAVAALALTLAALGTWGWSRAQLCRGAEGRLAGVWDAERKQAVQAAFLATGAPYAAAAAASVERSVEAYTRGWAQMHRDACEATRLRGEQSEELLDRRMFCLDRRLGELAALLDLFARADPQVVQTAVEAAGTLPDLASCADLAALSERVPPPSDPAVRRRVDALAHEMVRAKALRAAGKFRAGLALARDLPRRARGIAYRPIEAEALYLVGDLEEKAGEVQRAERTLEKAVWSAEAAAHDEVKLRSAMALMSLTGGVQSRFDRAREWQDLAVAILARLGEDERLAAELTGRIGSLYTAEGRYAEALEHHRRAVVMLRRSGAPAPDLAAAVSELGVDLFWQGRYPEARQRFEETLALQKAALGPWHPSLGSTLNRLANTYLIQSRLREAEHYQRQALAIREAALGPGHKLVADSLANLGHALDGQGRHREALASYRRALEIRRQALGETHPEVALVLTDIGIVLMQLGRWHEGFSYLQQTMEVYEQTIGRDHPRVADLLQNMAVYYREQGREKEALACYLESLAIREKNLGPDHPDVAQSLTAIGNIELAMGRPERARSRLERALRIVEAEKADIDPGITGRTHFAMARTLQAIGEGDRALELGRKARSEIASLGDKEKDLLADVDRWLAQIGGGAGRPPA